MRSIDLNRLVNLSGMSPSEKKHTLMCQDILRYYLKINGRSFDSSFRFTDVGNFLIRNNDEILQIYDGNSSRKNTSYSNRLHGQSRKIHGRLNELIELDLMRENGAVKCNKNDLLTMSYKYTKKGIILSYLLGTQSYDEQLRSESLDYLSPYVIEGIEKCIIDNVPNEMKDFKRGFLKILRKKSMVEWIIRESTKDIERFILYLEYQLLMLQK